jgi:hypothetical protein
MVPNITNNVHWICDNSDKHIKLVDNFQYDNDGYPIVPNNDFIWIDIEGNVYNMHNRENMPPMLIEEDDVRNYYW